MPEKKHFFAAPAGASHLTSRTPVCRIVEAHELGPGEDTLLRELDVLLKNEMVRSAISSSLGRPVANIRAVFFDSDCSDARFATALLEAPGKAAGVVAPEAAGADTPGDGQSGSRSVGLLLGLRRSNRFIRFAGQSAHPQRAVLLLAFLGTELPHCQQVLVSCPARFAPVRPSLGADIRTALIRTLPGRF